MLTDQQIAAFKAEADAHNVAIKAQLVTAIGALATQLDQVEGLANGLVITNSDATLRIRDTVLVVIQNARSMLMGQVNPFLVPPPVPPGASTPPATS